MDMIKDGLYKNRIIEKVLELKMKTARPGRNPKTGQEVTIAPRRVTTFKAGQKLRDRISQS